ncbi:MAG: competence protein ComEA [Chloroflexi bacterium CG_4_9_14_3_um_filter_45_9]|nr:MAG: competence protein ComEA [Chloroflexi bacterium CG_4_9_14_3_um_filter_45_9]
MSRADRFYLFVTVFLVIAVIAGGVIIGIKRIESPPIEVVLSQASPSWQGGEICVDGAVSNPGFYPWKEGDTVQALLLDAGIESDADLNHIKIYIPQKGEKQFPQKIDLNRAEAWLLEALPGIGKTRAQAIVDYRNENGPFKRIEDLLQVKGIGQGTFEKIKDYITVSD